MSSRREPYWLIALAAAAGLGIIVAGQEMNPPESIGSLQQALESHPNDASLHERLGNAFLRERRLAEAKPQFETAMALDPKNAAAPYSLATVYVSLGDEVKAQNILTQSLKTHPEDAATNELLADLAVKSMGEEIAIPVVRKNYEMAIRNDPTRASAAVAISKLRLQNGDIAGAEKVLEMPLLTHPRNAAVHLQLARVLAEQKQYAGANDHFNTGTALDPTNAKAFCEWGTMMVDAGWRHADTVLRQAIQLDDKNMLAHMELGRALRDQGEWTEARDEFARAIDLDDTYAPIYLELARMMLLMRNDAAAAQFLKDAIHYDPQLVDAYVELARLRMMSDDPAVRNEELGLNTLQDAIVATKGRDLGLIVGFARALGRKGRYQDAIAQLDLAMELPDVTDVQTEALGELRQSYKNTLLPNNQGPADILNPDALVLPDPMDYPNWQMPKNGDKPIVRPLDITGPPMPKDWKPQGVPLTLPKPDTATQPGSQR